MLITALSVFILKERVDAAPLVRRRGWSWRRASISRIRIHLGPGRKIYTMRQRIEIIILLAGSPNSMQLRDIASALEMSRELKEGTHAY
jgi:putative addiction module killer protein